MKNTPEPVGALSLTGDCYKTLGVRPAIGRLFTPADDIPYGPRVTTLGYGFWRDKFGGNPNVLGQTIRIEGAPFTMIGVTEPRFHGLLLGFPPGVGFLLSQEYTLGSGARPKSILLGGCAGAFEARSNAAPSASAAQLGVAKVARSVFAS